MTKFVFAVWCVALLVAGMAGGCSQKQDTKKELENTEVLLSSSPAPSPAAPAPDQNVQVPAEMATTEPAAQAPPPAQQMKQAIAAYKTGQLEDAVTRLQKLRATPTLTAQQRMAVQDSVAAVMAEIYAMAEKGDARAIAAVRQYEEMQTRRR